MSEERGMEGLEPSRMKLEKGDTAFRVFEVWNRKEVSTVRLTNNGHQFYEITATQYNIRN